MKPVFHLCSSGPICLKMRSFGVTFFSFA
uniref:Uncharacterized protein n=1 Tax=Arundo donax TaxID=35708 RepID=A0A0A8XYX8_ARUDO